MIRATIQHHKTQQQAKDSLDRGFDKIFDGFAVGPVEFTEQHRHWHGDTLNFSLVVKMGFVKTPIKGTVLVGEKDVVIEVDLGLLEKLVPAETVRAGIEGQVKGLLT